MSRVGTSNFNPIARGRIAMNMPQSNLVASNSVDRATFENFYAGPAHWDIGRPQRPIAAVAARVTGPVLDAGCGTRDNAQLFAAPAHPVTCIAVVSVAILR